MRTSGTGKSEILLFVAPAAIFGGFFLWLYGDPRDVVFWLNGTLVHAGNVVWDWCATVVQAIAAHV
jgi:hypothetical protein